MRILVTGSRDWPDAWSIGFALSGAADGREGVVVVHGDARGADRIAADAARSRRYATEAHPVSDEDWQEFGRRAGVRRNEAMVVLGADVCLAFPTDSSRGTWDCVRRARKAGIPTRIHLLRGQVAALGEARREEAIARPGPVTLVAVHPIDARLRPLRPGEVP